MNRFKTILKSFAKYTFYFFISLLLALAIRLFLYNFYIVPGDSMEPAILPGDFILANKWIYGARIFSGLKFDRNSDPPIVHMPGFRDIRRNDVLVFNFPYRYGWDTIRMNFEMIFVKRCLAISGDSISIIGGFYHVAGLADTLGNISDQKRLADHRGELPPSIVNTFPYDTVFKWNILNFGPLFVPASGTTIPLTLSNFKLYRRQIAYETGAVVRLKDTSVYINDNIVHDYTFNSNWYFVAGDNVMNSQDSRYFGLIPEAYIIGVATRVIASKDGNSGKWRWKRIAESIK